MAAASQLLPNNNIIRGCLLLKASSRGGKSAAALVAYYNNTTFRLFGASCSTSSSPQFQQSHVSRRRITSNRALQPRQEDHTATYTLLYHRSPSRSTPPRAMLGISTLNLTYWTWYVADFTPSVNAAAEAKAGLGQIDVNTLNLLLIDPKMGYVGLGIAAVIWGGAFMYAKQLVSAIWKGTNGSLAVSCLKFPLLTEPKILRRTVFDPNENNFDDIENIKFTRSELESESSVAFYSHGDLSISGQKDTNDILVKYDGDFSKKVGHLALKIKDEDVDDTSSILSQLSKQKYLVEIGSGEEIMPNASPHLLRSLVIREHHLMTTVDKNKFYKSHKESKKHSTTSTEDSEEEQEEEQEEQSSVNSTNVGRSIQKKGFRNRRNR